MLKPTILCGKPPRDLNVRRYNSRPSENRTRDRLEVTKRRPRHSHLSKVFEPHPREITINEEKKLRTDINTPAKMISPARPITVKEV